MTAKGTYQPTGGSGTDLPGDSAVATQIASLSGVPAAIRITANVPVTASAVISGGAPGAPGAISAAAVPVTEQGVAAANPAGSAGATQLVISAPGRGRRRPHHYRDREDLAEPARLGRPSPCLEPGRRS